MALPPAPVRRLRRRPLAVGVISSLVAALLTWTAVSPSAAGAAGLPYQDATQPVATRVSDLLSRMTLDEKIAQMTQAERNAIQGSDLTTYSLGSLLSGGGSAPSPNTATAWADMYDSFQRQAMASRLGIPLIYGIDAVHGHNNVYGATLFPHNIGLGATRNPALLQQIGEATAREVAGTGIDWDFSPCLCVARNDRWGRTYESFGELPEIATSYGTYITGMQGATLGATNTSILATAKHYIGDGGTTGGVDQGNTQISETELRAIHLPPFQEAIRRNVGSVMASYSSWNGVKLHGQKYLLTDVLKGELGFSGFVISDWQGIDQIDGQMGFSASDVSNSINAGIDMVMVPTEYKGFMTTLRNEVQAGRVSMTRIDDANRRILRKKFELGLFERPYTDRSLTGSVGSQAHRNIARQAVRESQVLLKNANNVLPLPTSGGKIFVAGKTADNMGYQNGGWTISWQGGSGPVTPGTTILQGIRNTVGGGATVSYDRYGNGIDSSYRAAIAVVGETPYTEGTGDRPAGMGLDQEDLNTIARLKATGVPVIVVLVSGRPLDIASQLPNWHALVASWLPGTEGQGVADVLFGSYKPTGKLPVTWPSSASQEPINQGDGKTGLFAYGYGLTYSGVVSPPPPPPAPSGRDAFVKTEAESFDAQSGVQTESTSDVGGGLNVGYLSNGDSVVYTAMNFGTTSPASVTVRNASAGPGGTVQVRLDSSTGPVVASVPIVGTGGWQTWRSSTVNLTGAATGTHDVVLTISTNGGSDVGNINWFMFNRGTTPPPPTGAATGAIKGLAGKCADVAYGSSASGTRVQLYTCNGTNAQRWTVGTDGTIRALGKCLRVSNGSTADGAAVQLWDCDGTGAQQWRYTAGQDLVNPQADKCLDVTGNNAADATPLQLWTCGGTANQKWTVPTA